MVGFFVAMFLMMASAAPTQAPQAPRQRDGGATGQGDKYTQEADLGKQTSGSLTVAVKQMTALEPGKTTTFHVYVTPTEPRPVAVRSWVSAPGAKGAPKHKAELEDAKTGMYHAEPAIPPKIDAEARLHVEVQPASGRRQTFIFNPQAAK
jgi:hypothetical protein